MAERDHCDTCDALKDRLERDMERVVVEKQNLIDQRNALDTDLLAANLRADNAENVARTMMEERDEAQSYTAGAAEIYFTAGQIERDRDEARTTARELRDKYEPGTRLAWEDPEPPETLDDIAKLIERDEHECGRAPYDE